MTMPKSKVWFAVSMMIHLCVTKGQQFASPAISVLHDVCVTRLDGCNRAFTYDRVFIPKKEAVRRKYRIRRIYNGITAMITANHGWLDPKFGQGDEISSDRVMFDWTNYEHFAESCYLFHSLVRNYGSQIKGSIDKYAGEIKQVTHIALPQVRPSFIKNCGQPSIPGLVGQKIFSGKLPARRRKSKPHGLTLSEGYVAFARGAVAALQELLKKETTPDVVLTPELLFCDDIKPHRLVVNRQAPRVSEVVCFDTVIEMDPFTPHLLEGNVRLTAESPRQFQADVGNLLGINLGHSQVQQTYKMAHMSVSKEIETRVVTLLTRKQGPEWINRNFISKEIQKMVEEANRVNQRYLYHFQDAGHAEDFALSNNCYSISPQIQLWSNSWLVISPHGAHETNVMFMRPHSGGLVEGFACGHRQNWFEVLANLSQVPYHAAQETDNGLRVGCLGDQLGRKYLKEGRNISLEHDTLFAVIRQQLFS